MSSFIPRVSSSPPPMEDGGGFGWDDDDDNDDEFGNFKAAPSASVSNTWLQTDNKSIHENTDKGFDAFSTHNGETSTCNHEDTDSFQSVFTDQSYINKDTDDVKESIPSTIETNCVVHSGIFSASVHSPINVEEGSTDADTVDVSSAARTDLVFRVVQNDDEETVVGNENIEDKDSMSQVKSFTVPQSAKDCEQNISVVKDNSDIPVVSNEIDTNAASSYIEKDSSFQFEEENISSDKDIQLQCASLENTDTENNIEINKDCENIPEDDISKVNEVSEDLDKTDEKHKLNDAVNNGPDKNVEYINPTGNEYLTTSDHANTMEQNFDVSYKLDSDITECSVASDECIVQDTSAMKGSESKKECLDFNDLTKSDLNQEPLSDEDDFGEFADISMRIDTVVENTEELDLRKLDQGSVTYKEITSPDASHNLSKDNVDHSESVISSDYKNNFDEILEEDVQEKYNSIHCEDTIEDKESEFVENAIEDEDFGDFNATNDKDWAASKEGDEWSAFPPAESVAQEKMEEVSEWAGFSEPAFQESKQETETTVDEASDWAAFSEPQVVTEVDSTEGADEDWGDFGVESAGGEEDMGVVPTMEQSPAPFLPPSQLQNMSKEEKLCYAVMTCFPCVISMNVLSESGHTEQVDIAESGGLIWDHMKAEVEVDSFTYQWTKSQWNSQLFTTLHIDTRNVLIGHKKTQVPVYAAGLALLEPIKGQTPTLIPEPVAETAKPDLPATSQDSIPVAQFDWTSSGLTNPLE
ncbi:hypothetical protein DPMN_090719, partial [Dreissena polymorpha]